MQTLPNQNTLGTSWND